ncbi:hypothetical protein [Pseudomonas chlororaphis]|jgi:hypothetical protein|uniref:hypothetical protein n=1 Tax=Pseudomonas chlororaphis TaxID=587753 RepID=UPI0023651AD0|nr:hypothetical protein [Pseudomonas chlororaphis]WDG52700.1 hypothetical protein PUP76_22950 [Pseudomonas chlororaphis]WDH86280.1 hypothetical protein PUP74_19230 [Pseudomonas chlororaphis]
MNRAILSPLSLVLALLAGCASPPEVIDKETAAIAEGVLAFRDICLKSAPSFAGADSAAKAYGIARLDNAGYARMGLRPDHSLGVQVQKGKQCAVTTPSQRDKTLTEQFLKLAEQFSSTPVAQHLPAKITLDNQTFLLMHDRRGGEAYVMLKQL